MSEQSNDSAEKRAKNAKNLREWRLKYPEKAKARDQHQRELYREKRLEYARQWRALNPDKCKAQDQKNKAKKRDCELTKTREKARKRTCEILFSADHLSTDKAKELIGCYAAELKAHIASQFKAGMTWENHGEWQLDHIVPLASAKTVEELPTLLHYTNTQPLWKHENLKKGTSMPKTTP